MTIRQLISISAATGAIAAASPVLAQPEMTYEQNAYEYAKSAPAMPAPQQVVFTQQPVVQPIPAVHSAAEAGADYAADDYRNPQPSHEAEYAAPEQVVYAQDGAQQVIYPQHGQAAPPQPSFDRSAWLAECRDRVGGGQRRDRNGKIIGGLAGAAAGGLIGNRIAGRGDRLGGTLLGTGLGGLAGVAIGNAIDRGNRADRDEVADYCEQYLDYYSNGYNQQAYYYTQQPMMLVPVMIQVPQRAVTREIITYETVNEEVTTYQSVPARRHAAPQPTKRIKLAPQPSKRVRYIKGK